MRRTSPAAFSARSTSYTAWWDTSPRSSRTTPMIESVSEWGLRCTAVSTASRGRVTRSAAPRNIRSKSAAVGTRRSIVYFLESIKIWECRRRIMLRLTSRRRRSLVAENVAQLAGERFGLARISEVAAEESSVVTREHGRSLPEPLGGGHRGATGERVQRLLAHGDHDARRRGAQRLDVRTVAADRRGAVGEQRVVT